MGSPLAYIKPVSCSNTACIGKEVVHVMCESRVSTREEKLGAGRRPESSVWTDQYLGWGVEDRRGGDKLVQELTHGSILLGIV